MVLEKARFVYLELGKMVSFNEEYWFGNSKIKNKIYKSQTKIEDLKDIKNNKIICVSLSNLYNYMMGRIGIKAVQAHDVNDSRHVYSEFEIDGKRYKADLQKDLHFIQTKRRTWEFGEIDVLVADSEVNTEEIEKIDAKIGYSYQGEKNSSSAIAFFGFNFLVDFSFLERTFCLLLTVSFSSVFFLDFNFLP